MYRGNTIARGMHGNFVSMTYLLMFVFPVFKYRSFACTIGVATQLNKKLFRNSLKDSSQLLRCINCCMFPTRNFGVTSHRLLPVAGIQPHKVSCQLFWEMVLC